MEPQILPDPNRSAYVEVSCVTTLYKSERFVEDFVKRMDAAVRTVADRYEIILVDDGSPDNSRHMAEQLLSRYPSLRVVALTRNFGHHPAILAGLELSRGEKVFLIDCDLEEDPELIAQFWAQMANDSKLDVVYGFHRRVEERALRRLTSGLFWRIFTGLADVEITPNLANVRLMRRPYVSALLSMQDRNVFLGGMFAWPGFSQRAIEITRQQRSDSSYSWRARLQLASLAAISFSKKPLILAFWLGVWIALMSLLVGIVVLTNRLVSGQDATNGWSSIMLSIWFLGGLLMGSIGLVGLYVAQIFDQVRGRPRYIIRSDSTDGGQ